MANTVKQNLKNIYRTIVKTLDTIKQKLYNCICKDGTATVKKGSEVMNTPTAAELLVRITREAEQRRILEIANECKDLEELKAKLKDLINSK